MSKIALLSFWLMWLLDVLLALYGYREFISGVFGRYAAPTSKYISLWLGLFAAILGILGGSLYFKYQGNYSMALTVAAIPLVLGSPYALWIAVILLSGKKTNWR